MGAVSRNEQEGFRATRAWYDYLSLGFGYLAGNIVAAVTRQRQLRAGIHLDKADNLAVVIGCRLPN
jgi:hypothetical protein